MWILLSSDSILATRHTKTKMMGVETQKCGMTIHYHSSSGRMSATFREFTIL